MVMAGSELAPLDLSKTRRNTTPESSIRKMSPGRKVKTDHIVLREWLYKHRYNAYPTQGEMLLLANQTQLTQMKQILPTNSPDVLLSDLSTANIYHTGNGLAGP